ncbi:MAG: hypothetical protein H7A46_06635 [Verrucomicrobiales bacterium]|nr:hypothetical protein [Verrucomicrobiales bacterium]
MGEVQGIFDFEAGNPDGFANWRREQEAWRAAVREEWKLPVGRRVRVRLVGMDREIEGELVLRTHPRVIDHRQTLDLGIGNHAFSSEEIESLTRLD